MDDPPIIPLVWRIRIHQKGNKSDEQNQQWHTMTDDRCRNNGSWNNGSGLNKAVKFRRWDPKMIKNDSAGKWTKGCTTQTGKKQFYFEQYPHQFGTIWWGLLKKRCQFAGNLDQLGCYNCRFAGSWRSAREVIRGTALVFCCWRQRVTWIALSRNMFSTNWHQLMGFAATGI